MVTKEMASLRRHRSREAIAMHEEDQFRSFWDIYCPGPATLGGLGGRSE